MVLHVPVGMDAGPIVRTIEQRGGRVVGRSRGEVSTVWVPQMAEQQVAAAVRPPARLIRAGEAAALQTADSADAVAVAALARRATPEYRARKAARPLAGAEWSHPQLFGGSGPGCVEEDETARETPPPSAASSSPSLISRLQASG